SGISGTFGTLSSTLNANYSAYISPGLTYAPNDVYLTLNPTQKAFTSGQGTPINDWGTQYSLLTGEQTVLNVQGGTAGAILKVNGQPDPAVWVRGLSGTGGAYGASLDNNGLLIGYGTEIRPGLIIGGALGNTNTRASTTLDQVKTRSYGAYLYTLFNNGPLFIDATATGGSLHTDSLRNLQPTGLIATGSASGSYAGISARAGYRVTRGIAFVTPYVGLGYLHTHRSAYSETGAGLLNLSYAAVNYNLGTFTVGARIGADWEASAGVVVSPWLELGGIAYTGDRNKGLTVTLGSQQQVLPATGAPSSAATVNAGVAVMSHANWSAQLVYHGQFSQHTHMNTGDVKIVYRW
ncbi:MAG: autotransporter outer membrane beta-barrel domain-containing protein, partial [Gammaproteobacteria bacterium]